MAAGPNFVASYKFGPFRLDAAKRLLLRDGELVHLAPKVFDTLLVLVERHGRVVEKTDLINRVWPDSFVEEINLTVYISTLRKILGDSPDEHQYIVTNPRRGYSFVAGVCEVLETSDSSFTAAPQLDDKSLALMDAIVAETPAVANVQETRLGTAENGAVVAMSSSHSAVAVQLWSGRYRIPVLLVLLAVVAAAAALYFSRRGASAGGNHGTRSIAVLPFKTLGDSGETNLELGMADALITRLSRLDEVNIRPTSTILSYAGKSYEPQAAGRDLGVDAVMLGNVQQSNDRIRVSVQLIAVSDGHSLWSDHFDSERINIFAVEDFISEQVAKALALHLTDPASKQLALRRARNVEAYQSFSRGLYFWNKRSDEPLKKAIAYFEEATKLDPNYAEAYAYSADCWALLAYQCPEKPECKDNFEKARAAATRAIAIDDASAPAHGALALVHGAHDMDVRGADSEYRRALEADPNYATAHQRYAWFLLRYGELQRAGQEMKLAAELDPLSAVNNAAWGNFLFLLGEPVRSIEQCRKTLEVAPDFETASYYLGLAYEQNQQYDEAISALRVYADKNPEDTTIYASIAHVYGRSGRSAEARRIIHDLEPRVKKDASTAFSIGLIYAGMGDRDRAFAWLDKGAQAGATSFLMFRHDPRFAPLREDPRFNAFLHLREGLTNQS